MSVFVIAEAGVNHNGSLDIAKRLVDVAVESGADAVKFQTFKAYEANSIYTMKTEYQKLNTNMDEEQLEMVRKLELPFEQFVEIKNYCRDRGIIFLSTPDGEESLKFLMSLDIPLIKVSSTDATNHIFLKKIGETMKPILLSTGMCTLGEVEKALEILNYSGNNNITLLHCTTDYPTNFNDVNLKALVTMKEAFKIPVGFSDHTVGNEAAVAAVALGAELIEKHITLSHDMNGPDHKASSTPEEFRVYVNSIRNTERLLGSGIKRPTMREMTIMKDVRRSIVAAFEIKAGTKLTGEMLLIKRPAFGIKPEFIDIVIGRELKKDLMPDEPIKWEYI